LRTKAGANPADIDWTLSPAHKDSSVKKLPPSLLAALVASALLATGASAATVNNGTFSAGLDGWTVVDKPGDVGTWSLQTSDLSPSSGHEHAGLLDGNFMAADQTGEMSSVAFQDIALEPEQSHDLSLSYWHFNHHSWLIPNPLSFDYPDSGDIQFFRIDVVNPTSDPFTTASADILTTLVAPSVTDPVARDWTEVKADLSAFAGRTVRLRAVSTATAKILHVGLDNVAIKSTPSPAPVLSLTSVTPKSYRLKTGKQGVTVKYTLSRDAFVVAVIQKSAAGRRSGKKCAKPSKKNEKGKRCTRWLNLTSHSYTSTAGANSFRFDGKIHNKRASAGNYRITLTPNTTLTHGATTTLSFKVKPAKKKRR
jgi:hypothetical protein